MPNDIKEGMRDAEQELQGYYLCTRPIEISECVMKKAWSAEVLSSKKIPA